MNADDLDAFLRLNGLTVATMTGKDNVPYTVIEALEIPCGSLAGRICDVAIARTDSVPYVVAPAIHTRPALVPMNSAQPLATQPSPIGPDEWQYWSRRFDRPPTPKAILAHILTILCDPTWPTN